MSWPTAILEWNYPVPPTLASARSHGFSATTDIVLHHVLVESPPKRQRAKNSILTGRGPINVPFKPIEGGGVFPPFCRPLGARIHPTSVGGVPRRLALKDGRVLSQYCETNGSPLALSRTPAGRQKLFSATRDLHRFTHGRTVNRKSGRRQQPRWIFLLCDYFCPKPAGKQALARLSKYVWFRELYVCLPFSARLPGNFLLAMQGFGKAGDAIWLNPLPL